VNQRCPVYETGEDDQTPPPRHEPHVPLGGVEPPAFAVSERRPYHPGHNGMYKRRVQESNLLGCDPVGGLAGRSLTGRPTLQRALYGIRTRDLLLDGEASTPLDRQDLRTRRGIRTPNLRLLTTAPLPVGLPGHCSGADPGAWTTSVSNRTRAACKAVLHTCASPLMYHVPVAGFEPATSRLSTWRLCRLGHTGKSRWERRTRTSTGRVRAGDAADYISSQGWAGAQNGYGESNSSVHRGGVALCH
jgi:hypothetical protein